MRLAKFLIMLFINLGGFSLWANPLAALFVASPIVQVKSSYQGFGVLSQADDVVYILTNSHILRGQKRAQVTVPLILPFESHPLEVPKAINFQGEVVADSDDPVGDIVLLKVPDSLGKSTLDLLKKTASNWVEFCEISVMGCWDGYRTFENPFVNARAGTGILFLEKAYASGSDDEQKLTLIPSFEGLPVTESNPDEMIAAENKKLLMLSTYGRPGLSGSAMVGDGVMQGLLTISQFDGTPMVFGSSLSDIAHRLQKALFHQSSENYQVLGRWDSATGDLMTSFKNYIIIESNSNPLNGRSGGGEGGTSGGGEGGTSGGGEGGTSGGGEGGTSGDRSNHFPSDQTTSKTTSQKSLLQIETSPLFFGFNSIAPFFSKSLSIRNPLFSGSRRPLKLYFRDSASSTSNSSFTSVEIPYLVSNKGRPLLATSARVTRLLLEELLCDQRQIIFGRPCNPINSGNQSDETSFYIPDPAEAGHFLQEGRLQWPVTPKYIRYYHKHSANEVSDVGTSHGNAPTLDNTQALEAKYINSAFENAEESLVPGYQNSPRGQFGQQLQKSKYESRDQWGFMSLFPFAIAKSSSEELIHFRFEDRDTSTYLEVIIPKNGQQIQIKKYDLKAFRKNSAPTSIITLDRVSKDQEATWRFRSSTQEDSSYRAMFSFDRDNLINLERIFLETPNQAFELIGCQLGQKECMR